MGTAEAIILAIFLPVIYGAAAFLFGIIGAALYNLVASWTGGLELVVEKQDAGA